ncbi:hypothetical protein CIG75_18235 [Tumebacillus algifaecis]|uniref:Uncharacterized protein n=1 Tax=Tumebacillus algifaecis TaxID=1214604 RepID=A0A223D517_9BACL|nr:hypothetical protein [Tumebacillus algifaecis]ASS76709.1 hypothetical protein CIG75_18235 [Tumebacillus algifaecis]
MRLGNPKRGATDTAANKSFLAPSPLKRSPVKKKRTEWRYLSTVEYGTATEPRLDTLRWFWDEVLRRPLDRQLLALCAKTSPRIARRLARMDRGKCSLCGVIDLSVQAVRRVQASGGNEWAVWLLGATVILYHASYAFASLITRLDDEQKGEEAIWSRNW